MTSAQIKMVCVLLCFTFNTCNLWHLAVPIIAIFTKYDQFPNKVEIELEDEGHENVSQEFIEREVEKRFQEKYLGAIPGPPVRHVKLEGETVANIDVCL